MKTPARLDVLLLATHPDDAESTCGGTLAKLVARGARVGVLDATRGEMGTRGSAAERARECAKATRALGLAWRGNLELPDGRVAATIEARELLVGWIRKLRPSILIAPWWQRDLHPDHAAVGRLARQAYYLAGLRKLLPGSAPHRPDSVFYYPSHDLFRPHFVVPLTEQHFARKMRALHCYRSQVRPREAGDVGRHLVYGSDLVARIETRARFFGEIVGAPFGEPFRSEKMLQDAEPFAAATRRRART